jgi:hypothetical protein
MVAVRHKYEAAIVRFNRDASKHSAAYCARRRRSAYSGTIATGINR